MGCLACRPSAFLPDRPACRPALRRTTLLCRQKNSPKWTSARIPPSKRGCRGFLPPTWRNRPLYRQKSAVAARHRQESTPTCRHAPQTSRQHRITNPYRQESAHPRKSSRVSPDRTNRKRRSPLAVSKNRVNGGIPNAFIPRCSRRLESGSAHLGNAMQGGRHQPPAPAAIPSRRYTRLDSDRAGCASG